MRTLTILLCILLLALTGRADDFPRDIPPVFEFSESYHETVIADPDFPDSFIANPSGNLNVQATASISGFDLNQLDLFTPFSISVGDFYMDGQLGDDPNYDPSDPTIKQIAIPVIGFNSSGDAVEVGNLSISWFKPGRLTFQFIGVNCIDDATVTIGDYFPDVNEPDINIPNLLAAWSWGPFSIDTLPLFTEGSARATFDDRLGGNKSDVSIVGAIDSVPPSATIVSPAARAVLKLSDVAQSGDSFLINITGTASDTRQINKQTRPGDLNIVEVRLDSDINGPGTFTLVNLDSNGNWTLPNVEIFPGTNIIYVRVTDKAGNVTQLDGRRFSLSLPGNMTVTATATGYSPADNGVRVAGTITGTYFSSVIKQLTMVVGNTPPSNQKDLDSGALRTVIAKPGKGSVFNGWVGKIGSRVVMQAYTESFTFGALPNVVLTADFTPNPFSTAIVGTYQGIAAGDSAVERGPIKVVLSKTGGFTGSIKIGAVTLAIKGKALGSGDWKGKVTKNGVTYDVAFHLNVGGGQDRLISGTVDGGAVHATFEADRKSWKKGVNDPSAYVGVYNVLLPASNANTDLEFPIGIGFGRITIGKTGTVAFLGKLGDGSAVTAGCILAKRLDGSVFFPLHIALEKGVGSVSGVVEYDNTQPQSDLTATLEWSEPVSGGIEPQNFIGQIDLHGSRYVKPAANTLVILGPSNGAGTFTLEAPEFTKPVIDTPAPLVAETSNVTLAAKTNGFGPIDQTAATGIRVKIDPATGLITGSFKDVTLNKTIQVFGAVSQKANVGGGVFVRGNRAGVLELMPPLPTP